MSIRGQGMLRRLVGSIGFPPDGVNFEQRAEGRDVTHEGMDG